MPASPAPRLFVLAATLMVAGWACSTGTHRDQFYGTDVGVGWIPGDASALMPRDASAGDAAALDGALDAVDALAQLKRLPMAHFRVEPCVPEPETGGISPPGPEEGSLADRSLAALMRYCEQYAITCLLEVWRGGQQATINYRRGEIVSSTVDGSDDPERLPEVMTWTAGQYQIVLPP